MTSLEQTINQISPSSEEAQVDAEAHQATLTKPSGSLGRLEGLATQIASITDSALPSALVRRAVIVMAGDHGVIKQGISAYPSEVTAQMVHNFANGGAAVNVIARTVGARVIVVDIGVASNVSDAPGVISKKVVVGTDDLSVGPAMSREDARRTIEVGIEIVEAEIERGLDIVCTGEMGIGNTTAAAAIVSSVTGQPPHSTVGRGTGLNNERLAHKISVVEASLAINSPIKQDGLDILAKVGGAEIGGMVGVILGAAAARIPVVIDGYIAGAAALIAATLCPFVTDFLIAGHRSAEPGHTAALEHLRLQPVLDLDLRLGEGTGALLALPIIDAAIATHRDMATFASAGVSASP